MTTASSLAEGFGLSHERVEDGCKSTYVKFGGLKNRQNLGYGKLHVMV